MSQTHFVRTAIATVLALSSIAAFAVITNPTPQRAYVSLHGLDTNNCGPTAPCRTFAMALTQVNPNGEVLVLDSGGFGLLSITQSVSIVVPPGVYAGMSVFPGVDGVTINAPGARVELKGLTVNGQGGATGINIISAGDVVIADSTVTGMVTGINMASAGVLHVTNTRISANSGVGIHLTPSTGKLFASVHGSHITSNGSHGIDVADNTTLDLKGSDVSVNGYGGSGGYGLNGMGTIALAPNLSIGIDAQNNDFSANSSGGVSIDDTSGTLSSIAYLEHNAAIGNGNCFNVAGTAGMKLAWNTAGCTGSGVTVGANASGLTFGNNSITAVGAGVAVSGTLTATSFR